MKPLMKSNPLRLCALMEIEVICVVNGDLREKHKGSGWNYGRVNTCRSEKIFG